jgi:hypothetical protein
MFVWSTRASRKVHQLGPDGKTICQLENNPKVAGDVVCFGEVAPTERALCGICRYLRKRPTDKTHVRPESRVPVATAPAQIGSHRLQLTLPRVSPSSSGTAASAKLKSKAPKVSPHPDDAQHHRLSAQRAYERDRFSMSQYIRHARSAHYKVLTSVARLPHSPSALLARNPPDGAVAGL